jgi:predicted enzyme related to lactoylglutathione lyase
VKLRAACIQARDALPLVAFYRKVFGREPEVDGGVDFRFRDEQLTVYQMGEGEGPETRGAAMIYKVEDVDAEYARLNALGLANLGAPTDKPWGVRSFMIQDSAGNLISFTKDIQKSTL